MTAASEKRSDAIAAAGWVEDASMRSIERLRSGLNLTGFPHLTEQGDWITSADGDWTGGFWIGMLWEAFEQTGDRAFHNRAVALMPQLLYRAGERRNHDLGMLFCPSAVRGWELTQRREYRSGALRAAHTLASQLHNPGGFIPGWGYFGGDEWQGHVLVDTLMNLPLVFWAGSQESSAALIDAAHTHAETTLRHHIRSDGSTYHVYRFDPKTGTPIGGDTYQGLAPESCWSRGQAWAIAGFAQLARMTGRDEYLVASLRVAQYFASHLPSDLIPYWDFAIEEQGAPRDSSAAAIAAYGLLALSQLTGDNRHLDLAEAILHELARHYLVHSGQSLLGHAAADVPHGRGVDEGTVYGDFYFLRSLQLLTQIQGADS